MKPILFVFKLCFFLIISLCVISCKKNNTIPVDRLNIVLYDKPLSVIRQYIQGKWQLIYGKGGIATTTQYYYNNFWEFNDDSLRILGDNNVRVDTAIHWIYNLGTFTNGDSTYIMNFRDKLGYIYDYVVDQIYNDTLILHEDASDAYFYHFIKSN